MPPNEFWRPGRQQAPLAAPHPGLLTEFRRKRQQARAQVRVTIKKVQDRGLPQAYTPQIYETKTDAVFQHIYDCYYGAGKSIYAPAA